jgi:hypothetical protein
MSLEQLQRVEPAQLAFATVGPALSNGTVDPICRVAEGHMPQPEPEADDRQLFVAIDEENFGALDSRLGVIAVDDSATETPQLEVRALHHSKLAQDPALLHGVVEAVLEELDISEAIIHSSDTNLPASFLRRAGFSALQPAAEADVLEFKAAA